MEHHTVKSNSLVKLKNNNNKYYVLPFIMRKVLQINSCIGLLYIFFIQSKYDEGSICSFKRLLNTPQVRHHQVHPETIFDNLLIFITLFTRY